MANEGTISALKTDFGFIRQGGGEPDVFFHRMDLVDMEFSDALQELRVQFDVIDTGRGPRAKNVRAVN